MTTEPLAYPLPDFLKRYGVSRSTAYREINAGRLEARKRGSRTIITAEAAQAWLDSLPALEPKTAA
jgi:predicted DNA-binding transcriptional regulator AlpA